MMIKSIPFSVAALFAGLSTPAWADTVPGTQSAGNFELMVRVEPPSASTISVVGLDDIPLGTVYRVAGAPLNMLSVTGSQIFCINQTGYTAFTSPFPGKMTVRVFQVGGGVNGEYALKGPPGSGKYLPVTLSLRGGQPDPELSAGGHIRADGSTLLLSPTPSAACNPNAQTPFFDRAFISVLPDSLPTDSDQADGELRAIFALILSPAG
jgi:hypothetical protein